MLFFTKRACLRYKSFCLDVRSDIMLFPLMADQVNIVPQKRGSYDFKPNL